MVDKAFASRFIKGIAATSVGTLSQITLGMLSLVIAIRYVSKEEFGGFVLIQVIATLLVSVSNVCLENTAITKMIASTEDRVKGIITNTAICYQSIIAMLMSVLIFLCRPLFLYIGNFFEQGDLFIFIPLFYVLNSFNAFFYGILRGFYRYKYMASCQLVSGMIKLLLIIVLLSQLKMGLPGLIWAFICSQVVSIVLQFLMIPVRKRINLNLGMYREILKFGFPLGLNNILTMIYTKIDRFMLGGMIGPIGVAYYEVASKIPDSSSSMFLSYISVFFPNMSELFSKKKYAEATEILNNSLRVVSFVIMFGAFVALLFEDDIVEFLFSAEYLESASALSLLIVSLCIFMVGNVLGISLVSMGQSDKPVKINLVDVISNIIGNLVMIPVFGFMGAVYSTLLARATTNPIYVFCLWRSGINVKIREYLKPFIIFGVCSILFVVLGIGDLYGKLFLIALFLVLCWMFSVVGRRDVSNVLMGLKYDRHGIVGKVKY